MPLSWNGCRPPCGGGTLYRPFEQGRRSRIAVRLIPYYAWSNRGKSEMTVWLPID